METSKKRSLVRKLMYFFLLQNGVISVHLHLACQFTLPMASALFQQTEQTACAAIHANLHLNLINHQVKLTGYVTLQ